MLGPHKSFVNGADEGNTIAERVTGGRTSRRGLVASHVAAPGRLSESRDRNGTTPLIGVVHLPH